MRQSADQFLDDPIVLRLAQLDRGLSAHVFLDASVGRLRRAEPDCNAARVVRLNTSSGIAERRHQSFAALMLCDPVHQPLRQRFAFVLVVTHGTASSNRTNSSPPKSRYNLTVML